MSCVYSYLTCKSEELLANRCGFDRQPGTVNKAKYTLGRTSDGQVERLLWLDYVMDAGLYYSLIEGQRGIERSA